MNIIGIARYFLVISFIHFSGIISGNFQFGYSISSNVCGPGLYLQHYGTIAINGNSGIGRNGLIYADEVIGANGGNSEIFQISKNVFIGPGAKFFGDIRIEDGVYIGANSLVSKSVEKRHPFMVGVPAQVIKTRQNLLVDEKQIAT